MKYVIIPVIIAVVAISFVGIISIPTSDNITYIKKQILTISTEEQLPIAEAAVTCDQSISEVKASAPFPVLTPTVMLEGYSLKGAEYIAPDRVSLKYSDGNVCGQNAKTLRDGVIEIIAGPLNTASDAKDGSEFVSRFVENAAKKNTEVQTYIFNGKNAVGYQAGLGKSLTIDENNQVILEESFDYPATVFLVDDNTKTLYRLNGFVPLEDLSYIAQSLK